MILLTGQSSYCKVHLKRLGAPRKHIVLPADKLIHLGRLTGTIPYLVITQNLYIYIYIYVYMCVCIYNLSLRWNYTDLARWLAHLNSHPASRLWSYLCLFEWFAILFSRGPPWLRDCTQASCIASRFFTIWATREALFQGREYIQVIWKGFCQTFSLKINYFLKNIPW